MPISLQMLLWLRNWVTAVTQRSLLQVWKNEAKLRGIVQLDSKTKSENSKSPGKAKSSLGDRYAF
jgi:hypothetical protein